MAAGAIVMVVALAGSLMPGLPSVLSGIGPAEAATSLTFSYTGAAQTWTVPSGVTSVEVTGYGAQGGGTFGGFGAMADAVVPVTPGQVLQVNVGGAGGPAGSAGGWNGGGGANFGSFGGRGSTGGGGSDVRAGAFGLVDRLLVAGGGGGMGLDGPTGGSGGSGGFIGETGGANGCFLGGGGGTQTAGGAGAANYGNSGGLGFGGGSAYIAGDGGGGYYGGGSGGSDSGCNFPSAGGGGGSSFAEPSATAVTFATGANTANGKVVLSFPPAGVASSGAQPQIFAFTAQPQNWVVPAGVTSIQVDMAGGAGAGGAMGGRVQATVAVVPGQIVSVVVGGAGVAASGGYNGGGAGNFGDGARAGGGGGSDIRVGGNILADRVVVAGGAGGTGRNGAAGGVGGGLVGGTGAPDGCGELGGGGGTQAAGGASGGDFGSSGGLGAGGGGAWTAGDGGGGYYGGGSGGSTSGCGGPSAGGGGGSGFAVASATNVTTTAGFQAGNGYVIIAPAGAQMPFVGGAVLASDTRGGQVCSAPQVPVPTVVDPLNVATGLLGESAVDLATPGRGMALSMARTYSSDLAGVGGPLGSGWTDAYNMSLAFGTGSPPATVTVTERSGSRVAFAYNPATATYAPVTPRDQAALVRNASGPAWTYTCRARALYDFDASGTLVAERDLNANTTTIGAQSAGSQTITDPAGRTYTRTFSGGLLTGVAEAPGGGLAARRVSYAYTGALLTSVTDVNGGVTDYGYEGAGRLAVMRSPRFHADGALAAAPTSCGGAGPAARHRDALRRQWPRRLPVGPARAQDDLRLHPRRRRDHHVHDRHRSQGQRNALRLRPGRAHDDHQGRRDVGGRHLVLRL